LIKILTVGAELFPCWQTGGRTEGRTDGWTDGRTDGRSDGHTWRANDAFS